jgi:hypothetical protein
LKLYIPEALDATRQCQAEWLQVSYIFVIPSRSDPRLARRERARNLQFLGTSNCRFLVAALLEMTISKVGAGQKRRALSRRASRKARPFKARMSYPLQLSTLMFAKFPPDYVPLQRYCTLVCPFRQPIGIK